MELSQQTVQPQMLYNTQTVQNPNVVLPNASPMNYALNSEAEAINLASRLSDRPPTYSATANVSKQ